MVKYFLDKKNNQKMLFSVRTFHRMVRQEIWVSDLNFEMRSLNVGLFDMANISNTQYLAVILRITR